MRNYIEKIQQKLELHRKNTKELISILNYIPNESRNNSQTPSHQKKLKNEDITRKMNSIAKEKNVENKATNEKKLKINNSS